MHCCDVILYARLTNEFYSRDISKKVRSGKFIRASQGKFMGTYAPFGYKKDPADKNHLIVDEATAPTVRYIFQLALKGYGNNKIGKVLYAEKIPKPAYYKQEQFGKFLVNEDDAYDWKQETVIRILRNPLYKGYTWVQRCDKKHFKQRGRGYIPLKDRTIIPSSHEAIVDEHTWDTVQEILDRHTKVKPCTSGYDNKFRGLLKCADCGSTLMIHTDGRNPDRPLLERTYYICRTYRVKGTRACSQHRISAADLERIVLADIQYHAGKVIKDRERFMRELLGRMDTAAEYSRKKLRKKLEGLEKKLRESDAEQLADEMAECAEIRKLTTAIVNRLIEKIEVSEPQTMDREKIQNIRIFYKFVGEIN